MANTRFVGTYEFKEDDRFNGRPLPISHNRYVLSLKLTGELEFEVDGLKGKITIDRSKSFASADYTDDLHRDAIKKFKEGGVDKLIKNIIINAIKDFKNSNDSKINEVKYKELISSVTKYSIELTIKPKDL